MSGADSSVWPSFRAALALAVRTSPGLSALSLGLMAAGSCLPAAAAWAAKLLVDGLTTHADSPRLIGLALATVTLGGASALLGHLGVSVAAAQQRAVTLRVEGDLYAAINRLPGVRHFEDPAFANRLRLAEQSASGTPSAVVNLMVSVVRTVVTVGSFIGVVVAVWWPMLLLLLATAVPSVWLQLAIARRTARTTESAMAVSRQRFQYQNLLTDPVAAKEIRLFGLGGLFQGRIADALADTTRRELAAARRAALVQATLTGLGLAVTGLGAFAVVVQAINGRLTAGDVMLFVAAVGGVQGAFGGTVGQMAQVGRSLLLFRHYLDVVRTPSDLPEGTRAVEPLRGAIEFHDVWFRYSPQAPWALRGVSVRIPAGSVVGLVGVNGAGKSTMAKLLCRLYDPDRGRITWDGVDIRELSITDLRRRIGVTFQDFVTYELTAAENIGVGDVRHLDDDARIRSAAAKAGADTVVDALPAGYATPLTRLFVMGEDGPPGTSLSGGQAQRVALARSLMRTDAELLVHDEPCSALDAHAAEQVTAQLAAMRAGRTTILISHRLAALRTADTIIVLDGGTVAEQDGHDELMSAGGRYAAMFTTQAAGYQAEPVTAK